MDATRAELRQLKAAKKAAKRSLREAHRAENVAKSLATEARHDESKTVAAAEAAAKAAAAAPVAVSKAKLVSNPLRRDAARHCGLAVEALRRQYVRGTSASAIEQTETSADELLKAMGKGRQTTDMFSEAACTGYVWRKFSERSLLVFTALCDAQSRLPWAAHIVDSNVAESTPETRACVVSLGGGPGCCLYGYALAERLLGNAPMACARAPALESWDYVASAWEPWCRRVDAALFDCSGRLCMRSCDVTAPALSETLRTAAGRARLFLVSYVLTETRGRWEAFVEALYDAARPGALLLCAEPTDWQPQLLLALLRKKSPALRFEWLDVRTSAAPPSVLLLEKPPEVC